MADPEIVVHAPYSKDLVAELFWLYVRKKFLARTTVSVLLILLVALAAVKELYTGQVIEGIIYAILAPSLLGFTIMQYVNLYHQLASGYLLGDQNGVAFRFTDSIMSGATWLKIKEIPWVTVSNMWVSENLIVFVNRKKTGLALPKQALGIEAKKHIADQLRHRKSLLATWKKIFPELQIEGL